MTVLWYQYFQVFSLLCALFCRRGLDAYSIGIMIPLLLLDNTAEFVAGNYHLFHWKSNYFIYNLYLLASTPIFLYLFSILLELKGRRRTNYFIGCGLLEIFILLNFFFYQGPSEFNTYSNLLIQATNIVLSCLALARLAIGKDDESVILQDPRFCINAMILLFSLVTLITLGSQKYIVLHNIEIHHKVLYYAIMPIANAVLYTGYSCAFVLCRMQISK
jgi:hypothetical protein